MSAARDVSTDDPHQVADMVPAHATANRRSEQDWTRAQEISAGMAARFGAPTVEHYRRVYTGLGQPWPGEDEIRRRYPVADAR